MTPPGSSRQGGGRRTTAVALGVLAIVGAAFVVFALTNQVGAPPQPDLRTSADVSEGGGSASTEGTRRADPSPVPSTEATDPDEGPEAAPSSSPPAEALAESAPTSLTIPSIGVDERVFPIGLGPDGELLAPSGDRANLPAWFEGSPTPGEPGPSVIEGHVTWGGDPSVFFELGGLAPGDRIDIEREDGTTAGFEVYDSARYPKNEFPTLAVYGRTEGPELRLITCSGDVDEDGHHLDNTVISARLIET